jgi:hypothetical protein
LIIANVEVSLLVNLVLVDLLVDVSEAVPLVRAFKLVELHIVLESFRRSICVPKFEAAVNILLSWSPLALNVAFEGLSENRVELSDVLLKSHDITI